MTIISYFELPEDKQPPPEIWGNDKLIGQWFEAVKNSKSTDTTPGEVLEDVPQTQNEYAKEMLSGR